MIPIGKIRTPYKTPEGMPIQGAFRKGVRGTVHLYARYRPGLEDIEGFSHLILVYHFHHARAAKLTGKPYLEDAEHGIFAIRAPQRPNRIGISVVKFEALTAGGFNFSEVDILDNTPLLDIKPYVSRFDVRKNVKNGWLDKHFEKNRRPARTIVNDCETRLR